MSKTKISKTDQMADADVLYHVFTEASFGTQIKVFSGPGALERAEEYKAKEQETFVYVRLVQYMRVAEL